MPTPKPNTKRSLSALSCSSPSSSGDDERPQKKLALSLNRLSLTGTTSLDNDTKDLEMKQRKSYEKDEFTTVIESLSTSTSDNSDDEVFEREDSDAPFPRDEAHVTILSEIEKRLTKFPHTLLAPSTLPDTALVLYRSPESMGLPRLERQNQEDMKSDIRRRILEKRRNDMMSKTRDLDGYEADAEDWEERPSIRTSSRMNGADMDEEDGEMMDLD
jgi:hypothetical protein